MPPSIAAAKVGVTTGEWAQVLREVFGEYRAPTGVGEGARLSPQGDIAAVRVEVEEGLLALRTAACKLLVGKPRPRQPLQQPNRSPCAPGIAAWRCSTRASA